MRLRQVAVKRGERRNGGGDKRQPKQCNAAETDPLSGWASLSRDGASCCIYGGGLGTFGLWRVRATYSHSHFSLPYLLGGIVPEIDSATFNTFQFLAVQHVSVGFSRHGKQNHQKRNPTFVVFCSFLETYGVVGKHKGAERYRGYWIAVGDRQGLKNSTRLVVPRLPFAGRFQLEPDLFPRK